MTWIACEYLSVKTRKIYDALVWLVQNNEDYKDCDGDQGEVATTDLGDCSIIRVGRKVMALDSHTATVHVDVYDIGFKYNLSATEFLKLGQQHEQPGLHLISKHNLLPE
jgi:hypothetical protein